MAKLFVFLAEGFEEVEALTPVDYLRRAGLDVVTAAVGKERLVCGSHKIPVMADTLVEELEPDRAWDGLVLPGGIPGAPNLAASGKVASFIAAAQKSAASDKGGKGKLIAAICASPALVLAPLGVLAGRRFTCYPGLEAKVSGAAWLAEPVVVDGNICTSRGAGTAAAFSLAIIEYFLGKTAADKLAASVLL